MTKYTPLGFPNIATQKVRSEIGLRFGLAEVGNEDYKQIKQENSN